MMKVIELPELKMIEVIFHYVWVYKHDWSQLVKSVLNKFILWVLLWYTFLLMSSLANKRKNYKFYFKVIF